MQQISEIEARQAVIFQQIANHVAKCNDIPAIAAWGSVAAEVELAVEALLRGMRNPLMPVSAEIECLIDMWRLLEVHRQALRAPRGWKLAA